MTIQDQQGMLAKDTVEVMVCDCEDRDVCRGTLPLKSSIGAPGMGLIFAGLLLFLCKCGN